MLNNTSKNVNLLIKKMEVLNKLRNLIYDLKYKSFLK